MILRPVSFGVSFGVSSSVSQGVVMFSPLDLFVAGEQGAWYDPSDITTLFQDTAGTTPVTASGQSVARMLDKSGRGNHLTQATAGARPIYRDVAGLKYLEFDGVDDSMSSASANFTAHDKVGVYAAIRKTQDTNAGSVTCLGGTVTLNSFELSAPNVGASSADGAFRMSGSGSASQRQVGGLGINQAVVMAGLGDIAGATLGEEVKLRVNGVLANTVSVGTLSTGTLSNAAIHVGRRGGSSLAYGGHLFGLIIRSGIQSNYHISSTESFLGNKCGVSL